MLVVDMDEETSGTQTFDMEGLEVVIQAHDAKELGAEVFHIEELVCQDFAGMKQDVEVQVHMYDVAEDMGDYESGCSLEAFEWSLVDFERQSNLEEDYFGE